MGARIQTKTIWDGTLPAGTSLVPNTPLVQDSPVPLPTLKSKGINGVYTITGIPIGEIKKVNHGIMINISKWIYAMVTSYNATDSFLDYRETLISQFTGMTLPPYKVTKDQLVTGKVIPLITNATSTEVGGVLMSLGVRLISDGIITFVINGHDGTNYSGVAGMYSGFVIDSITAY